MNECIDRLAKPINKLVATKNLKITPWFRFPRCIGTGNEDQFVFHDSNHHVDSCFFVLLVCYKYTL